MKLTKSYIDSNESTLKMSYSSPKIVPKTWGMEIWYCNTDYCGKRLIFAEDHRLSIHYHKVKHETFLIECGCIQLELYTLAGGLDADAWRHLATLTLRVGDTYTIEPGLGHRMMAVGGNACMIEFSTHHEDADSYRIDTGQIFENKDA